MAAAAGFINRYSAAEAINGKTAAPMSTSSSGGSSSTSGSGSSTSSSSDSSTISANDFLTLLVTEMQNQDPTADTDPNEYINQLVNVNSLQQLIGINQTLTGAFDPTTDSSSTPSTQATKSVDAKASPIAESAAVAPPGVATSAASIFNTAHSAVGNLNIPTSNPSAMGVAHALDGNRLPALH